MKGSFTIRHNKKDGRRFTYSGDLKAAIDKAEKELSSKMSNTTKRFFFCYGLMIGLKKSLRHGIGELLISKILSA